MMTPPDRCADAKGEAKNGYSDDENRLRFVERYMQVELSDASEEQITAAALKFFVGIEDE